MDGSATARRALRFAVDLANRCGVTLITSVLRIGMTFVGVSVFAQQRVFGAALILAVTFTIDRSRIKVVK